MLNVHLFCGETLNGNTKTPTFPAKKRMLLKVFTGISQSVKANGLFDLLIQLNWPTHIWGHMQLNLCMQSSSIISASFQISRTILVRLAEYAANCISCQIQSTPGGSYLLFKVLCDIFNIMCVPLCMRFHWHNDSTPCCSQRWRSIRLLDK